VREKVFRNSSGFRFNVGFVDCTSVFVKSAGVLSGADIQKSRSSGIVMLAGKYGILDKKLAGN